MTYLVPKTFPQLQVRGTEGEAHRNLWKGNEIMGDSGLRKSKASGRIGGLEGGAVNDSASCDYGR